MTTPFRYFANPSTQAVRDAMSAGLIGMISTPKQGNPVPSDATWCADNGCFGKGYPGDDAWYEWLRSFSPDEISRCTFAVAPDVMGDAEATLRMSTGWLPRVRALGYPAAFVAQNGQENLPVPWDQFDVLFIGGDTAWKLSPHARELVSQGKHRQKHVHMGRVNSESRIRYANAIGCDSVDGTFISFGPDTNLPQVLAWVRGVESQGVLEKFE